MLKVGITPFLQDIRLGIIKNIIATWYPPKKWVTYGIVKTNISV